MNTRSIIEIFKRISFTQSKTPLGRWNINNHKETTLKIKYATEDNCGIAFHNYKNIPQPNNELDHDNEYIYVMGYDSLPTYKSI